jgi:hypothetical protein
MKKIRDALQTAALPDVPRGVTIGHGVLLVSFLATMAG